MHPKIILIFALTILSFSGVSGFSVRSTEVRDIFDTARHVLAF